MSKTQAAYIAGFFDGEGCVSRSKSKKGWPSLVIGQRRPEVLYRIQKTLGYGYVRGNVAYDGKTLYKLHVARQGDKLHFIQLVLPYSVVKKEELLSALEWLAARN